MTRKILDSAVEILKENPSGLPYREFIQAVALRHPEIPREDLADVVGDLPRVHPELIWRPKPGHFAIRTEHDIIRRVGRPPRAMQKVEEERSKWPARPLPNRVENIKKLGFEEVGFWMRTSEGMECRYTGEVGPTTALLAYVINDNVVFIGRARRAESGTNPGRVARAIRAALNRDLSVKVFALAAWPEVDFQGVPINVAAGIEDELIERMQPPWNNL